jgi:hypothetical protein
MPGQNTSFHDLLTRIAAGTTTLNVPEDVDTAQQLISFGYATANGRQQGGHLVYEQVALTTAGHGFLDDWDAPGGSAIR